MNEAAEELIDWQTFTETRGALGSDFVRILGYFREDGTKSVAAIEEAMRLKDSGRLVLPAHTLKGEGWQFGAGKLAVLAEEIEVAARHYVEIQQDPTDLVEQVVRLRPIFEATLAALEQEASPLVDRRPSGMAQQANFGSNINYGRP